MMIQFEASFIGSLFEFLTWYICTVADKDEAALILLVLLCLLESDVRISLILTRVPVTPEHHEILLPACI